MDVVDTINKLLSYVFARTYFLTMSWRQARSSLSELSHILTIAPKNHAARDQVIGVQISDVGETGSHFSCADVAIVNAIVEVVDPN